jgi:hypothetical protein
MNSPWSRWLFVLTATWLTAPLLRAAEEPSPQSPQILFVQLRVKDGSFSLVRATNVAGLLKTQRRHSVPEREFELVLEDAAGKELWTDSIADPAVQRLEFVDPAQPGVLQVKEVRRTEAEVTVRLPARTGQRHLAIYRRPPAVPANVSLRANLPARELVSRLPLPEATP